MGGLTLTEYLFLGQWQRLPDEAPPHLAPESSMELHLRLNDDVEAVGRPPEETCWERWVIWNPDVDIDGCRLSVSPVNDDMNEVAGEEKLIVVDVSFRSSEPFRISCWWWCGSGSGGSRWIGVGQ